MALIQVGTSLIVLVAALLLAGQQSEHGWLYWILVVVAVVNLAEVAYFSAKYLRLRRETERVS
jgi:hypothetical protein